MIFISQFLTEHHCFLFRFQLENGSENHGFLSCCKKHKLWKTIENTVVYIQNCYLAVPNKCENSKPSLRKSAWKIHRKRTRKSPENYWKTTSTNMIQTLVKTCKFRLIFLIKIHHKSMKKPSKNEVRKQTWKTTPFFIDFLHILVPSGDPWGPPWAQFFLQNATRVLEGIASGRVLVIST